jgi:glutamate synthase domain-containing protein 2
MNHWFWAALTGIIPGLILGTGIVLIVLLEILTKFLPRETRRMLEAVNLLKKISWRDFFEANMRAQTGKVLHRPYGVKGAIFPWSNLMFNPKYLTHPPVHSDIPVSTEVILGPKALKPLHLKIPILIGGMAYGSGYSLKAKIALAKASTMAGTAANSGNGPFLEEERRYADRYIVQYPRGFWSKSEEILKQADMIEIALGHSARGSTPVRIVGRKITKEVAERYGTIPGLDVLMEARLPDVENMDQWRGLVGGLKEITGGVPIAVKFGATHYLEREMALFLESDIDVLVFDGTEGGTHGGMPLIMDDTGLPVFPALCRASKYIRDHGLRDQVSVVAGGGLATPGDFAKCLALGADAVLVGTITALGMSNTQVTKDIPWEPPTESIYNDGNAKHKYDPDLGAKNLSNYFQSCVREMQFLARSLGKTGLRELDRGDLVALDSLYAQIAEINYFTGHSPTR